MKIQPLPNLKMSCSAVTRQLLDAAAFQYGDSREDVAKRLIAVASRSGDLSVTAAMSYVVDALLELERDSNAVRDDLRKIMDGLADLKHHLQTRGDSVTGLMVFRLMYPLNAKMQPPP